MATSVYQRNIDVMDKMIVMTILMKMDVLVRKYNLLKFHFSFDEDDYKLYLLTNF